ncbi:peptidase M4 family protein, partial [Bacillus vallismortis]|nr:peptidase M4 family protein [Bacillus vallismortis]
MGLGKKLSVVVAASFLSLSISLPGVQAAENPQLIENQTHFLSKNAIAQSGLSAPNDKAVKKYVKK